MNPRLHYLHNNVLVIDQSEYIADRPVPGPFPAFPMTKGEKPWERGWGVGTGGAREAHAPPNFFKGLKVPFFVMKSALFCDEKCPFCTS